MPEASQGVSGDWSDPNSLGGNGQKTVTTAGTAVALVASSTPCKSVSIKALVGNTDLIYIGDSGVDSTNGRELEAGEAIDMDIDDLDLIYIDSVVNGEGVSYIYLK